MKLAVLSDIHANLPALEAVLQDIAREDFDRILIAGDLVSGGPHPRQTFERLRLLQAGPVPVHIIRGNNESYLLSLQRGTCHPGLYTSRQWGVTSWAWQQLGPDGMAWVAALPSRFSLDSPAGGILLIHASPGSESIPLLPNRDPVALEVFYRAHLLERGQTIVPLASAVDRLDETVVICGHTHIQWQQREGANLVLNPGSVGLPNNSDPRAQYAVLTLPRGDWQVEFRAVSYDRDRAQLDIARSGMLAAGGGIARAIQLDLARADNTVWKLVMHCQQHAKAAGFPGGPVIPDDLWLQAEETFF